MSSTFLPSPVIDARSSLLERREDLRIDETVGRASRARAYAAGMETAMHRHVRQFLAIVGEVMAVAVLLAAIPLAILAIGTPVVLLVRLAIWLAGSLLALV